MSIKLVNNYFLPIIDKFVDPAQLRPLELYEYLINIILVYLWKNGSIRASESEVKKIIHYTESDIVPQLYDDLNWEPYYDYSNK